MNAVNVVKRVRGGRGGSLQVIHMISSDIGGGRLYTNCFLYRLSSQMTKSKSACFCVVDHDKDQTAQYIHTATQNPHEPNSIGPRPPGGSTQETLKMFPRGSVAVSNRLMALQLSPVKQPDKQSFVTLRRVRACSGGNNQMAAPFLCYSDTSSTQKPRIDRPAWHFHFGVCLNFSFSTLGIRHRKEGGGGNCMPAAEFETRVAVFGAILDSSCS